MDHVQVDFGKYRDKILYAAVENGNFINNEKLNELESCRHLSKHLLISQYRSI